jgi:uncharacterized DUF497 family protein
MEFEWDEEKNERNIRERAIDFADIPPLFDGFTVTIEDDRDAYGEQRFSTIGLLRANVLVVVHTERVGKIRIISARRATRNEQRLYFSEFPH